MPRQKRSNQTKAFLAHVDTKRLRKGNTGAECADFANWLRAVRNEAEAAVDLYMDLQDAGEHPEIHGRVYELKAKANAILVDCDKAKRHVDRIRQAQAEMDRALVRITASVDEWENGSDEE